MDINIRFFRRMNKNFNKMTNKRKRNYKPIWYLTPIIMTCIMIVLYCFCIYDIHRQLKPFEEYAACTGIFILFVSVPMTYSYLNSYEDEYIERLNYIIYSFEIWDSNLNKYKSAYYFQSDILYAKFIFHFHIKDFTKYAPDTNKMLKYFTQRAMIDDLYQTKEEAYKDILYAVQSSIINKREEEHIKIKSCNIEQIYTIEELTKLIEK